MSVKWGGRVLRGVGGGGLHVLLQEVSLFTSMVLGGKSETKVTVDVLTKDQSKQNVPKGCFKKK